MIFDYLIVGAGFCGSTLAERLAREADACTFNCLDADIYPRPGVVLPRNAAVRILGSDSGPAVSVAVDGTEAAFIKLPALSGDADPFALCSSGAAVRAEPLPPIGSTVTFKVHGTPDETYVYVIGEPDFIPPAPLVPGHLIHVILGRDPSGVWAVA